MSSFFARSIGLLPEQRISADAAVVLVKRRSTLSHTEARLVVLDYLGYTPSPLAEALEVSVDTLKSYWRRAYKKMNFRHGENQRTAMRAWVEETLRAELEATEPTRAP